MSRITIVGAGFGGLTAARECRRLDPASTITLVAPRPEFVFLPSLIWIPSGMRQPDDLRVPLEPFLRRHRIQFHQGEATGLLEGGRKLVTTTGELENDGLIIASGGRFIKKLPGIEHSIAPCEGIEATVALRDRLAQMKSGSIAVGFAGNPNEPQAMRGGPMFEFLFGIDTLLRRDGRRDQFKLTFFSPAPQPGNRLGPKAFEGLMREMRERDIETHLGHKLKGFTTEKVMTEGGEFPVDLILFLPGMTGNAWFDNTELPRSPGGLLKADSHCKVEGFEKVYVAGDAGSFPSPEWMPKQAHMADLQAAAAASNLVASLAGRPADATFKMELACIVDSLDKGMLVTRSERRSLMLPPLRLGHWSKRIFEQWYLRKLR